MRHPVIGGAMAILLARQLPGPEDDAPTLPPRQSLATNLTRETVFLNFKVL